MDQPLTPTKTMELDPSQPSTPTTTTTPANTPSNMTPPPRTHPPHGLAPILTRLQYKLHPLHPVPIGPPHPSFPPTLLHYHLLTEPQLDSFATYYHQNPSSPTLLTYAYPATMDWDAEFMAHVGDTMGDEARVRIKRRKVGRFIGLRGCETPVEEVEERGRWLMKKREVKMKASGDGGFWGRRGIGEW